MVMTTASAPLAASNGPLSVLIFESSEISSTMGSYAVTNAPRSTSRCAMSTPGESRRSSVPDLNAIPKMQIRAAAQDLQVAKQLVDDELTLAVVN